MRVLWFVNLPLPAVLEHLNHKMNSSGWWLTGLARQMASSPQIQLTIANCSPLYKQFERVQTDKIEYWLIPANKWNLVGYKSGKLVKQLADLVNESDFDLVDIHGSEFIYGQLTPMVNKPVVLTIQGFANAVKKDFFGGSSLTGVLTSQPLTSKYPRFVASLLAERLYIELRAKSERKIFKANHRFIGRTLWDKSMINQFCPRVDEYYTCWEILREEFYQVAWTGPKSTQPPGIFCCAGPSIYKGIDDLLRACSTIAVQHPDLILNIAGLDTSKGFGKSLKLLSEKLNLQANVNFLPYLSAAQIAQQLAECSLCVHPSHVDNSPNALAEAMCVGTPSVGAATGGIPSMIEDGENGLLYKTGDVEQLASAAKRIICDKRLAANLGQNARETAIHRHDPHKVFDETLSAYRSILHKVI